MASRARPLLIVLSMLAAVAAAPGSAVADQWFKTDTHVHSVLSGDALWDLGMIDKHARDLGYDAMFITDHTAANNKEIGGVIANHVELEDHADQWSERTFGTLTASASEIVTTPVNTGTGSLHLMAGSSTSGEIFKWYRRGPNLRSGDIILRFSVYPTRIDAGSGLYVSASLGGDDTVTSRPPQGYTTADGVPHLSKRNVFVWQIGSPRSPSSDPDARVFTHNLSYTPNQWNSYTINVSQAIRDELPAADTPVDMNALTMLKLAARGNGGTAEGYFDSYHVDASSPIPEGNEFVHRNQLLDAYQTPTFRMFASQEVGYNRHAQRFNFDIRDPSQFTVTKAGRDSILPTQQSGYPAQLNHPGLPGGVTQQEAIDNLAYGADAMEVAERSDEEGYVKNVMVDTWDAILEQGVQVIGAWSSDAHRFEKLGPASYIRSPSLSFDDLMHSYYEGRMYLADNDFGGRAVFNLDRTSPEPYPARYPVYVSPSQTLALVNFDVSGGIGPGSQAMWTRNGEVTDTDNTSGPSYQGLESVPLGGPFTYIRAEVRGPGNLRQTMSEPIFFVDAPELLPAGMTYHVERVTTPSNNQYTKIATKGIVSSSWDASIRRLTLGLANPDAALVESTVTTGGMDASSLTVDGVPVAPAGSAATFDAATGSSWYFDSSRRVLRIKAKQSGATASVVAGFTPGSDTQAPSTPTGFQAHADGVHRVDLSWTASTGNAAGYTVYRDGNPVALVPGDRTTYTDDGLASGTTYRYTVDAFDASENHSAHSQQATATTDTLQVTTVVPVADSYVEQLSPTRNNGNSASLRIDGSPIVRTYLRFDVAGVTGQLEKATLRLFTNSNSPGHDVRATSNTWGETTINYSNAPAPSADVSGASFGGDAGQWTTAEVTPLVSGNGTVSMAVDTDHSSAINYASRQSANPPQLVIESSVPSGNQAPTASDTTITTAQNTPANWTPHVSDSDGDTLTCEIVAAPAQGSATVASDCGSGTYTPASGYSGSDSFTYRATDPSGAQSSPATVAVTVSPNQAPSAADAALTTDRDTQAGWTPAVSDPDGDPLTCQIVSAPAHGNATVASNCASGTYTPASGYSGPDSFTYRATDPSGAQSSPATVSVTVRPGPLFQDGFETGDLSQWTSSKGLTVQSAIVRSGTKAARGASSNGVTWARKTLSATKFDATIRAAVRLESTPTATVNLLKGRTAADVAIAGVYVANTRRLGLRNDVAGSSTTSTAALTLGQWYDVELRLVINGASSSTEVKLNGVTVASLSGPANLGANPMGGLLLGENQTGRGYDIVFDDVSVLAP